MTLASVKSRLVLPFWYRFTWVVLEKGPLKMCVCDMIVTIITTAPQNYYYYYYTFSQSLFQDKRGKPVPER